MKTIKTAVSLPARTYKRIETLRRKAKKSRSAIYAEALEKLAAAEDARVADERYAEAYRRMPETPEELAGLEALSRASQKAWSKERW